MSVLCDLNTTHPRSARHTRRGCVGLVSVRLAKPTSRRRGCRLDPAYPDPSHRAHARPPRATVRKIEVRAPSTARKTHDEWLRPTGKRSRRQALRSSQRSPSEEVLHAGRLLPCCGATYDSPTISPNGPCCHHCLSRGDVVQLLADAGRRFRRSRERTNGREPRGRPQPRGTPTLRYRQAAGRRIVASAAATATMAAPVTNTTSRASTRP